MLFVTAISNNKHPLSKPLSTLCRATTEAIMRDPARRVHEPNSRTYIAPNTTQEILLAPIAHTIYNRGDDSAWSTQQRPCPPTIAIRQQIRLLCGRTAMLKDPLLRTARPTMLGTPTTVLATINIMLRTLGTLLATPDMIVMTLIVIITTLDTMTMDMTTVALDTTGSTTIMLVEPLSIVTTGLTTTHTTLNIVP